MNHSILSKQNNVNDSHTLNKFVPKENKYVDKPMQ